MAKPTTTKKNKPLSKAEILTAIAEAVGEELSRKHAKEVLETLVAVGHKELKRIGVFVLHGFAKFVVVKKPARPAREGINLWWLKNHRDAADSTRSAAAIRS